MLHCFILPCTVPTLVPEMVIVHKGLATEMTCMASTESTDYKWLIDNVTFDANTSSIIYPNVELSSNFKKIRFKNVSSGLNGSSISCSVVFNHLRPTDHRRKLLSRTGTILVQGKCIFASKIMHCIIALPSNLHHRCLRYRFKLEWTSPVSILHYLLDASICSYTCQYHILCQYYRCICSRLT